MTGQPSTVEPDMPPQRPQPGDATEASELVLEDRFSMVPEWLLDADVGDCAVRLYAVLLRYGNTSGARMPARSTLAARLHKKSVDTVDRALADLVRLGAVQVENRFCGGQRLTNRYLIRTSRPGGVNPAPAPGPAPGDGGGRTDAATPTDAARGGRIDRGRVAARIGHDRESSTDTPPPPPPPARASRGVRGVRPAQHGDCSRRWRARQAGLLAACGIDGKRSWNDYAARVRQARRSAGQPLTRWSPAHLLTALDLAVRGRGWPPDQAATALVTVASDPATHSPARLAEAGPWWDQANSDDTQTAGAGDVAALEAELDTVDGRRLKLQQQARQQLVTEGKPVTRASVIQRAVELLHTLPETVPEA